MHCVKQLVNQLGRRWGQRIHVDHDQAHGIVPCEDSLATEADTHISWSGRVFAFYAGGAVEYRLAYRARIVSFAGQHHS